MQDILRRSGLKVAEAHGTPIHTPAGAPPVGLSGTDVLRRRAEFGPNEVPEVREPAGLRLGKKFVGLVPGILEAALVIEFALGRWIDGSLIVALLLFNALLAFFQEGHSQRAVELLRKRLPLMVRVLRDGTWRQVPSRELVPGDIIELHQGDRVPADCVLHSSDGLRVDQSVVTGESLAVELEAGGKVLAGTTVLHGAATAQVTATGSKTTFGKTTEIVQLAQAPGRVENLVVRLVRYLMYFDLVLLAIALVYAALVGFSWAAIVPFALILFVVAIPVALPATFTLANAVEAVGLASEGVLVTGLAAVQEAATMTTLVMDKTGTLTENRLEVTDLDPEPGVPPAELLERAVSVADESTQDPIDIAIVARGRKEGVSPRPVAARIPFDPTRKRAEATVTGEGHPLRVILGAPETLAGLTGTDPTLLRERTDRLALGGERVLAVAAGPEGQPKMLGLLGMRDTLRPTSAAVVNDLRGLGIRVVMATGDTVATARTIGRQLGFSGVVAARGAPAAEAASADVLAGILPEDKFSIVQTLQQEGQVVGMTGDGVNDAPAIRQADVGIAVSSATDVAKSAARLVLTQPGVDGIEPAVRAGRRVYRRLETYTLVKATKVIEFVTLLSLGLVVTGVLASTPTLMIFLIFANDFVTMSLADDRTTGSHSPNRWNVRALIGVSTVLALVWLLFSFSVFLVPLWVLHLAPPVVQTLVFVGLVYSAQATVYLMRTSGSVWHERPGGYVLVSSIAVIIVVSVLALFGWAMAPAPPEILLAMGAAVVAIVAAVDPVKLRLLRRLSGPAPGKHPGPV